MFPKGRPTSHELLVSSKSLGGTEFLFFCFTLAAIRPPRVEPLTASEEQQGFFQELNAGLRTLMGTRVLLTMLIAGALLALGSSAINSLNLFFVQQNLHAPLALCGLVGSLPGDRAVKWLGLRQTICASLLVIGVLVLIYARLMILLPALILLFIMGIPSALFNVSSGALIYHAMPRDMLGRTTSVWNSLVSISGVAGAALAGYLDSTLLHTMRLSIGGMVFGSVDTIFMVTGLLTLLGGLYAMMNLQPVVREEVSVEEPMPPRSSKRKHSALNGPVARIAEELICLSYSFATKKG